MKIIAAALAGIAVLAFASAAGAGPDIGFADDATKYADDGGNKLFTEMNKLGATTNRVAVFWDSGTPTTIVDQQFLDRMIPVAKKHNIQIVFAIYPRKASMAPTTPDAVNAFCNYAVLVMKRYTYVRKVIIGNEPNQPLFWQPIWNGQQPASPAAMEQVMAACYDALKSYDSSLDVMAPGLSPRGNDLPNASSNASISPVRWIAALGKAYRASGRTKPLFDEWVWHCYPNVNTDDVEKGYAWPNTGCVNAARVKLALWDAFNGTGQPVLGGYPATTTGSTLFGNVAKMMVDETGWQVDTTNEAGYTNTENVPTISEQQQAIDYDKLVRLSDCEPTLTDFHIFPMWDEPDRSSLLQSGVLRVDFSERPSATDPNNSVQHAIQSDQGNCSGGVWATLGSFLYSTSAVVPDYQTFPYQNAAPYASKKVSGGGIYVQLDAGEGFTYSVTFSNGSQTSQPVTGAAPKMTAVAKVPTGFGSGTATVVLKAETNPSRTTTVTLQLGSGGTTTGNGSGGKAKGHSKPKHHKKP